jgi:electron-transferring-flavoprotein dehydrogenase
MKINTDVLVIGGCTAGLYFAGLMAKQGYKVVVADKSSQERIGDRYNIIHIAREHFARFGLPEPQQGDPEYVAKFERSILRSALNNWPKNTRNSILVLRRTPLIKRIAAWAKEQGVELLYDTVYEKPVFNAEGKLSGGVLRKGGEELPVESRLVADASGIPAVVRTSLPPDYGVETFATGPRDQFYVVLHYVNLKYPEKDKVEVNTTWTHYKTWFAPQHNSNGAIMGIGANLSFDYAERSFQRFVKKGFLPEYELDHIEQSSTPYRRPPYSFVADGFIALGDAACLTNPWSGEGVPYAWVLCKAAAGEYGRAMQNGAYPAREAVWQVNIAYIKEQGALFAKNLAMLCGATNCTEKENDYEFKHSIIYEDDDEKGKGNLVLKLFWAFVTRGLSASSLGNLMSASGIGEKVYKHYLAYPSDPGGLDAWVKKADELWAGAGSMADLAEKDLASMTGQS